jgi:hypothetical protein
MKIYNLPNRDFRKPLDIQEQPEQDLLRVFQRGCRKDLQFSHDRASRQVGKFMMAC